MAHPTPEEYAPYYAKYTQLVPDGDILEILEDQLSGTLAALEEVPEEKAMFRYAPGKWTVKESFSHLIDAERIFSYRLLRIVRGDQTPLPGFEQDDYVVHAAANERDWEDLLEEFECVRMATLSLVRQVQDDWWDRKGTASDNPITVRALAHIIAGHELHHMNTFREQYQIVK